MVINTHSTKLVMSSNQAWSISDADQTGLDFTTALTITAWVKPYNWGSTYNDIISKVISTSDNFSYSLLVKRFNGNRYLTFTKSKTGVLATGQWQGRGSTPLSLNNWYFVAVTFSTTNGVKLFINGQKETLTEVSTSDSATDEIYSGSAPFKVGMEGSVIPWDGLIDDVRVWSRELSETDIENLYKRPDIFNNGANLEGWWKFDNNGNDSSSNGNDLTGENSPTFVEEVAWRAKIFNYGYIFG